MEVNDPGLARVQRPNLFLRMYRKRTGKIYLVAVACMVFLCYVGYALNHFYKNDLGFCISTPAMMGGGILLSLIPGLLSLSGPGKLGDFVGFMVFIASPLVYYPLLFSPLLIWSKSTGSKSASTAFALFAMLIHIFLLYMASVWARSI